MRGMLRIEIGRNPKNDHATKRKTMKKIMSGILPLVVTGGVLCAGCASHPREVVVVTQPQLTPTSTTMTRTVVVTQGPPPAPREENPGPPPAVTQVWVKGYWTSSNGNWNWVTGHWETRPQPNS